MKCSDCPEYEVCRKYDLRKVRLRCKKSRTPKVLTNADKIRNMTDEELAELLERCEGEGYQDSSITPIMENGAAIEDILGDDYDLDRLKELVQADREGKCVLLPCKVGDKLYKISENGVKEVVVQSIVFMLSHTVNHLTVHVANERGAMTEIETKEFGKTVFLTREEAEAALKKMNEGDE